MTEEFNGAPSENSSLLFNLRVPPQYPLIIDFLYRQGMGGLTPRTQVL